MKLEDVVELRNEAPLPEPLHSYARAKRILSDLEALDVEVEVQERDEELPSLRLCGEVDEEGQVQLEELHARLDDDPVLTLATACLAVDRERRRRILREFLEANGGLPG